MRYSAKQLGLVALTALMVPCIQRPGFSEETRLLPRPELLQAERTLAITDKPEKRLQLEAIPVEPTARGVAEQTKQVDGNTAPLLQVEGVLEPGDSTFTDDNSLYDTYTFEAEAGQAVIITLESEEFDTYLLLENSQGEHIARNDDISDDDRNSSIAVVLPQAGTYQVLAGAFDDTQRGAYRLTVTPTQPDSSVVKKFEADELNRQGRRLNQQARYLEALEYYERSLAIRQEIGDRRGEAILLNNIGLVYNNLGQYEQALSYYQQALPITQEIGDRRGEGTTLNNLGAVYRALSQYEQALSYYQQALPIRQEIGDRQGEGVTLNNIGLVYDNLGQYQQALSYYQQALPIFQEIGDHTGEGTTLNNIGGVYDNLGQYEQALSYYQQALPIQQEIGDRAGEGTTLNNIGLVYANLGQYEQALSYYQQALPIRQEIGDRAGEGTTLNNIGAVYRALGQYEQALSYYQQALSIRQEIGDRQGVGQTLNNIGLVYANLGQYQQALSYYQQALPIQQEIGDRQGEGVTLNNIGAVYHDLGQYEQALSYYQQALPIQQEIGDRQGEGVTLNNIGLGYDNLGQYEQALSYYQQALPIRQEIGDRQGEGTSLNNIGVVYANLGQYQQALDYFQQGLVAEEERLAATLVIGSDAEKQAFLATFSGSTHSYLSLHQQAMADSPEAARFAFTTTLQRKGRVLEALSQNVQQLQQNLSPEDQELFDNWQQAQAQLAALRYQNTGDTTSDEHLAQIAELREQVSTLESELARRSTAFRVEVQPATLAAVQAELPADAALVEIIQYEPFDPSADQDERWGEPRYAVYVLHPNGNLAWADLGEASVIDQQVQAFRAVLRGGEYSGRPSYTTDEVKQVARGLDALVMGKIRPLLGDSQHLLLSPDGQLNLIPFAALVDETNRYLAETYTITYLSSGRDLLRLGIDDPNRRPQQGPVVVTNPDYSNPGDATLAEVASAPPVATELSSRGATARSYDLSDLQFGRLSGTVTEKEAIVPLLPNVTSLEDTQATENNLKQLNAPSILHIATHGFFLPDVELIAPPSADSQGLLDSRATIIRERVSPENISPSNLENPLLRSGLALAGFNVRQSGTEDGVLTALETSGLNLYGTELVVLSACETGLGDIANGEGVYGLRRAFVIAGAESQLMSLWKVSDNGTADLMERYYQSLSDGVGRSEALRTVQLEMMQDPTYEHPYFWASFIFSGDWEPLESL
jgi:tetratricopeptide (TPR) repeat protein